MFYNSRIEPKVGVSLDLTKVRLEMLNNARERVKNISSIKFAYADINCTLRVLTESGHHTAFKSFDELEKNNFRVRIGRVKNCYVVLHPIWRFKLIICF